MCLLAVAPKTFATPLKATPRPVGLQEMLAAAGGEAM